MSNKQKLKALCLALTLLSIITFFAAFILVAFAKYLIGIVMLITCIILLKRAFLSYSKYVGDFADEKDKDTNDKSDDNDMSL